ncbi:MAG: hypothetical protein ABFS86_07480 [Planctomycetota bacterium]
MNAFLNFLGRMIFAPFAAVPPVVTILVLAVVVGGLSLLVFKWTSNQEKIRAAKAPMKAHLLGILLFRHDLKMVFRSLGSALLISVANIRFMFVPMLVMIGPLFLVFVQMEFRLGSAPLPVGGSTVLRVHLDEDASLDDVSVEGVEGASVSTVGIRVADEKEGLREVDFRIRGEQSGVHDLVIRAAGAEVVKTIAVGDGATVVSPRRPGPDFLDSLLYPIESPVPADGPVTAVEVVHDVATYPFLSIDWAWWTLFLVFMILSLFVLKGPMGIDF